MPGIFGGAESRQARERVRGSFTTSAAAVAPPRAESARVVGPYEGLHQAIQLIDLDDAFAGLRDTDPTAVGRDVKIMEN